MIVIMPNASRRLARLATMTALAIALAACGGGSGGGGSGLGSTPPAPPPPPPSTNFVNIFPNITTTTDFTVLGLEADALGVTASALVSDGFAVRFDAVSDAYVIDLPAAPAGKFDSISESNGYWAGRLVDDLGNILEPTVDIFKPTPANTQMALEHTTFGIFYDYDGWYDYDDDGDLPLVGVLAFGTATPAGGVPTTGSAVFDAIIAGFALDTGNPISGTGTLQFDFGAGTLAGSLNPIVHDNTSAVQTGLGSYGFVNTVFGVGSTTYSGQLQHAGTASLGAFNGMFTGPAAQELMAKWTAPYQNPDSNQWFEMFGVWVGRKQ